MVDRKTVELLCDIARKITLIKEECGKLVDQNKISQKEYENIRNLVCDCYFQMGSYCDCAPTRLIAGQVDIILNNLEE